MKVVWTEQCQDGRACAGDYGNPAFVPDGVRMCDSCMEAALRAAYDLESVHIEGGCSCADLSEEGFTRSSVVRAMRRIADEGLYIPRFYARSAAEWIDKKGNVLPKTSDSMRRLKADVRFFGALYDSRVPFDQRQPMKRFEGHDGYKHAAQEAKRLNSLVGDAI